MTVASTAPDIETVPPTGSSRRRRRTLIALAVLVPILAAFALVVVWYMTTRKPLSTLPGLDRQVPHYAFSIYDVAHPLGVTATRSGDRIYVTESDGDRLVRVYDRSGTPVGTLAPPATTGESHVPVYVAINPTNGHVYVSDRATATVYVYDRNGTFLQPFTPKGDTGGGFAPLGLAFDKQGRLYATDVGGAAHQVLVFDVDGSVRGSLGRSAHLSFPNGIAVDGHGNVYVTDSNNGRLVVFDPAGQMIATVTRGVGEGDLGLPRGVTVDGDRLYVVDTSNHTVRMYRVSEAEAASPKYLESFGEEGTLDGRFEFPNGIAADSRARLYVTDRENNRVQVWTY